MVTDVILQLRGGETIASTLHNLDESPADLDPYRRSLAASRYSGTSTMLIPVCLSPARRSTKLGRLANAGTDRG